MGTNADHVIVDGVPHVYQFAPGKSEYRCVAFTLVALLAFANPKQYAGVDLAQEASDLYTKYTGQPDIAANIDGMTKAQAVDCLQSHGVNFIDLQHFLDAGTSTGDWTGLHDEMAAMNKQGIPQLLTIADESYLALASNGQKLHTWNDKGLSHCFARLGMKLEQPWTFILDPAAPCPPFPFPTPVEWGNLVQAQIITALAILPENMPVPPADFRFYGGGEGKPDNEWPPVKPVLNLESAVSTLTTMEAAIAQQGSVLAALQNACKSALQDLGH